jgi:anti-sigma regulatory factor (Ser/Thr protein kinase)
LPDKKTIISLLKARLSLIAVAVFLWVTGAFFVQSQMAARETARLQETLKLSHSLVMDRLHLLQLELGQVLAGETSSDFELTAFVKSRDHRLVLDQAFRSSTAKSFGDAYLNRQLTARGDVGAGEKSKAFLWVDRGPGRAEYLFSLLPFDLGDKGASWGLAVSRLPSAWLQFSGSKGLFLIDQRSEKILSAYGGENQGSGLSSDFKEASSADVASVKLTSREALAWQDLPGTNLTLVVKSPRPSVWTGLLGWGGLSLLFLLGLIFMTSRRDERGEKLPREALLEETPAERKSPSLPLREEEDLFTPQNLQEMVPLKTEILTQVEALPSATVVEVESVVEDRLLESVLPKKTLRRGQRLLDGVEEALKSLSSEIQASGARINLLVSEQLHSDWPQTQLRTALEEVIRNALEAMETSETKTLTLAAEDSGDFIVLTVEDTGVGMTDEVRSRALEAFFSTKPSLNKRRGLGLNVAKRLLEISGGKLRMDSTPSVGTKVSLVFLKEQEHEKHEADKDAL